LEKINEKSALRKKAAFIVLHGECVLTRRVDLIAVGFSHKFLFFFFSNMYELRPIQSHETVMDPVNSLGPAVSSIRQFQNLLLVQLYFKAVILKRRTV
jgi:hypothetical protein